MTEIYALAAILAGIVALVWLHQRRMTRRDAALRELVDGADALEAHLHEYRERMTNLKHLLGRLPSDMTAPAMAMASINPESQVRIALRDVLAHRLWIQKEGFTANMGALDEACSALRKSRSQLEAQLKLLEEVGQQLEQAGRGLRSAYQEAAASRPSGGPDLTRLGTGPSHRLH